MPGTVAGGVMITTKSGVVGTSLMLG